MRSTRLTSRATAAALLFALSLGATALAADPTDRSFGQAGIAEVPVPSSALHKALGIWDLANTPDERLLAAVGDFSNSRYFGVSRFEPDGELDPSFGEGGFTKQLEIPVPEGTIRPQAQALAVDPDGRVVVAGYQENEQKGTALVLARYLVDGSLDSGFDGDGVVTQKAASEGAKGIVPGQGGGVLHDVAIQPGGRIVAVGAQNETHGGRPAGLVIAFRPDGRIDRSFGARGRVVFGTRRTGQYTALRSIQVLASGKVLVFGYRRGRLFLARLLRDGRLDQRFGAGDGIFELRIQRGPTTICCPTGGSLAVLPDHRILVQAEAISSPRNHLVLGQLRPNGVLDKGFGDGGLVAYRFSRHLPFSSAIAAQGNGRIVVVGLGPPIKPSDRKTGALLTVIRYLPNGTPDLSFGRRGATTIPLGDESAARAALTQPDGRVVVGGSFLLDTRTNREVKLLLTRFLSGE